MQITAAEVETMAEHELFPREVTSNVPHMTLTGTERLHVEQHRGLIAYQPEEIVFRTACGLMHVCGEQLHFRMYTSSEALISGQISGIHIDETGGGR